MLNTLKAGPFPCLALQVATAADLMTTNPLSLRQDATIPEAVRFLTDKGFGAAPVIDAGGRPVGVLSLADIVVHDLETLQVEAPEGVPSFTPSSDGSCPTRVAEITTPVVFSVTPEMPARAVVEQMVALRVHRLFVVDGTGTLVGVISALDVLRHLEP